VSVESDIVAAQLAYAPLAALIGDRMAPDKVLQGVARPYVVYVVTREPTYLLDGSLATTLYTFKQQVWADTRAAAEEAADALVASLSAAAMLAIEPGGIPLESREVIAEHDLDLEGTEIVFEHWVDAA
jgi:hypothetical protein